MHHVNHWLLGTSVLFTVAAGIMFVLEIRAALRDDPTSEILDNFYLLLVFAVIAMLFYGASGA